MSAPKLRLRPDGVEIELPSGAELPLGTAVRDLAQNDNEALALQALDEVWQEGALDPAGPGRWLAPYDRIIHLDEAAREPLGLPLSDTSLHAQLRSQGLLVNPDFSIELRVRHPQLGALAWDAQSGPAFLVGDRCVLATPELWHLKVRVSAGPPGDEAADRMEYAALCVEAARKVGAEIDGYLQDESYDLLRSIGLTAQEEEQEIVLGAIADGLEHSDLVLPNGEPKPFPVVRTPDGRVRRVVVSREARGKVREIQGRRRLRGTEVPEFLQNPEAFVPEGLDLDDFSDRVRGFRTRVYNSRPYLHVRKEPRGWLEFESGVSLEATAGGAEAAESRRISPEEFEELSREARRSGERFVRRGDDWVEIDIDQAEEFRAITNELQARAHEGRISGAVLLDVIPNVELLEFDVEIPDDLREERPWVQFLPDVEPPDSFRASLDQHQLLGFRWMVYLNENQAGGLLADEMGVGKTAQVLALFEHLRMNDALGPSLVVLPKTLIPNWQEELRRFTPDIRQVWVHMGPARVRDPSFLESMEIVVTTYDTARIDQLMLGTIDWKVVVADEAQFIKNPTAARTSVVKALKAKQALALTGTPVENGLIEFWCIVDYVQPGLLKSWREFRTAYERPLIEATADEGQRAQLVGRLLDDLDPHYLRRLKEEVLAALPPKRVADLEPVDLGDLQRSRYVEIIEEARARGREAVLGAIVRLLMTCSHPRAHFGDFDDLSGEDLIAECPKLAQTMEVLEKIQRSDEKALVFTTWKNAQRILQRAIWSRFEVSAEVVNGDLTHNRQMVIEGFKQSKGFNVLILAPEVAGFGLNLSEATHVIHYTRPWNPAKENQATDRVHRRGQTRPVTVYRPIVRGTVEERLAELLRDKEQLAHDVLRPTRERTVSAEELIDSLDIGKHG